ncbi:hypothetical protein E5288_WYG001724 [Bos mutus]|uniref:Uncharacterized protein n=1 Tax=Bos mutus TaxID=72004 RepID=A0A6B0RNV0_9CETA|nr:hypothetical protein [Bos mutus]
MAARPHQYRLVPSSAGASHHLYVQGMGGNFLSTFLEILEIDLLCEQRSRFYLGPCEIVTSELATGSEVDTNRFPWDWKAVRRNRVTTDFAYDLFMLLEGCHCLSDMSRELWLQNNEGPVPTLEEIGGKPHTDFVLDDVENGGYCGFKGKSTMIHWTLVHSSPGTVTSGVCSVQDAADHPLDDPAWPRGIRTIAGFTYQKCVLALLIA